LKSFGLVAMETLMTLNKFNWMKRVICIPNLEPIFYPKNKKYLNLLSNNFYFANNLLYYLHNIQKKISRNVLFQTIIHTLWVTFFGKIFVLEPHKKI